MRSGDALGAAGRERSGSGRFRRGSPGSGRLPVILDEDLPGRTEPEGGRGEAHQNLRANPRTGRDARAP